MSLLCWWPLNGDLHNQGLNNSADGTFSGTASYPAGKIGKCVECKSSSYVVLPYTCETTSNYTIAMWIKIPTAMNSATAWETAFVYSCISGTSETNIGTAWADYHNLKIYNATQQYWWLAPGTNFTYDQWFHLTLVHSDYNGGNRTVLYINGNYIGAATNATAIKIRSGNFILGNGISASIFFNDLRIYSHCLSPKEVSELAKGLIAHYKLDDRYLEPTINIDPSRTTLASWSDGSGVVTYTTGEFFGRQCYKFIMNKTATGNLYTYMSCNPVTQGAPVGSTVTRSCMMYIPSGQTLPPWFTESIEGNSTNKSFVQYDYTKPNTWQRVSMTGTITDTGYNNYLHYFCATSATVSNFVWYMCDFQTEIKDHVTPFSSDQFRPNTPNLVTGLQAGGRTTVSGNNIVTTGENADTYFYLKTSTAMVAGHLYRISCHCSGATTGQYWSFPIAGQTNTQPGVLLITNGYNELIFVANSHCANAGTSIMMDDNGRPSTITACTFSQFNLQDITQTIEDCSGYNHNATMRGLLSITPSTPRYELAGYINSPSPTDSSENGEYWIDCPVGLTTPATMTVAWWSYPISGYGGSIAHGIWSTTANNVASDYLATAFNHRDGIFDVNASDGTHITPSITLTANEWHHYAVTYDGQTVRVYKDGTQQTSGAFSSAKNLYTFTKILIGHSQAGGVQRKVRGYYSDFRVYATALSAAAVKELYETSGSVDNMGNVFAREVRE